MFVINARKKPRSLFWNSLPSPRVSQRNGTVHYLLRHLYFYCTSKQSSSTTKNQWGLILHYLTPTLHKPTADKAIPLAHNRNSGKVLPASVTGWQILVLSPSPPVDTGARNTAYVEGGWWPFPSWSPLLPCAAQLITEIGVGWLNCTSFSVLGEALRFFRWGFLEVTGIGGFWLRNVDFVPVLVQKKAVVPCWGKL